MKTLLSAILVWLVGTTCIWAQQPAQNEDEETEIGILASNVWSFAGQDSRSTVNSFSMQPFINYNFGKGWFITTSPIITSNCKEDSDERWLVPFGGGVGKVAAAFRDGYSFAGFPTVDWIRSEPPATHIYFESFPATITQ